MMRHGTFTRFIYYLNFHKMGEEKCRKVQNLNVSSLQGYGSGSVIK
jgi:hypothetical protein